MANSLLTISMITREALRLFVNSNAFLKNIDRQYDNQFAKEGAKIGSTLKIRLPNDFIVRTGAVASPADTLEQFMPLVVNTQKGIDMAFTSVDMALSLDAFSKRILSPAMNNLAGAVAADVMTASESASAFIFKDSGTAIVTPTMTEWLLAGAKLDNNSAPRTSMDRRVILDPLSQARTISSLSGLFQSQTKLKDQFETGQIANDVLGFDWYMDQTVIKHVAGTYTAGQMSATAGQTGSTLTTAAITGTLNKGDVITIAGVFAVNRVTKQSTGELQQFNVTANVLTGATSIPIYPAIVVAPAAFGTVTAAPAANATILLLGYPGVTYRKNLAYVPIAITMATADLELPKGVQQAARESYGGISLRIVGQYDIINDRFIWRLDILYGYVTVRGEWICVVADAL